MAGDATDDAPASPPVESHGPATDDVTGDGGGNVDSGTPASPPVGNAVDRGATDSVRTANRVQSDTENRAPANAIVEGEATANANDAANCVICLSTCETGAGKAIFTAECGHVFHFKCLLDNCRKLNNKCPLCRKELETPPESIQPTTTATAAAAAPARTHRRNLSLSNFGGQRSQRDLLSQTIGGGGSGQLASFPFPRRNRRPAQDPDEDRDDDVIEIVETPLQAASGGEVPKIIVSSSVGVDQVSPEGSEEEVTVLLTLQAPPADYSQGAEAVELPERPSVDLVAVLDTSGSMQGRNIQQLKATMKKILPQLRGNDRLSVVTYDVRASRLTPLTVMNGAGLQRTEDAIDSISVGGGTDICVGLERGVHILEQRRVKNSVSSVLLLTDGQDSAAYDSIDTLAGTLPSGCSVQCFGFGNDHDSMLLSQVAETCSGSFAFIEEPETVNQTFANCLGGLLSVFAQDISIKLEPVDGVSIASITSVYPCDVTPELATVRVPDIYYDEERDIVFKVKISETARSTVSGGGSLELVKAEVRYRVPGTTTEAVESDAVFSVRVSENASRTATTNVNVDMHVNRILAAKAMKESASLYENSARATECLTAAIESIKNSASKNHPMCKKLVQSLELCKGRLEQSFVGAATMTSSRGFLLTNSQSYSFQRSNSIQNPAYRTRTQTQMMQTMS